MGRFPRLTTPSVFIAAPDDLDYLRKRITRDLEALKRESANDFGLGLAVRTLGAPGDLNDALPIQEQIPLPSDPLCRAVICMFGEKIGSPLADTFPVDPIANEGTPAARGGARLVHPWRPESVAEGGFPLTGTVFEYLAAAAAHAKDGQPLLVLLFVGDPSILSAPKVLNGGWGGRRWREKHRTTREETEYLEWLTDEHVPQLTALRNFIEYVRSRSRNVITNIVPDEEKAATFVREALAKHLQLGARTPRDPFKALNAFDVEDLHVFFGRKGPRDEAVAALYRLWREPGRAPFYGLRGGSGVGKSSMMRAGVLAHLEHQMSEGEYVTLAVSKHELLPGGSEAEGPLAPLHRLYELAMAKILRHARKPVSAEPAALAAKEARIELGRIAADLQPEEAMLRLERALAEGDSERRLVIGLDQFEELIDLRVDRKTRHLLEPLFAFITHAAVRSERRRIGFVYTLQTNRLPYLEGDPVLGPIAQAGGDGQLSFPQETLTEIICRPFEAKGISLQPALERELRERILAFSTTDATSQPSLLPLVSMTLSRLYERAPTQPAYGSQAQTGATATPRRVMTLAGATRGAAGDLLDVKGAIADEADKAFAEALRASHGRGEDDPLPELLRRLVRRQDSGNRLQLASARIPASGPKRDLVDALIRHRLLVREGPERVRLVHEAVLTHWRKGAEWLESERAALRIANLIEPRAAEWAREGRGAKGLEGLGSRDVDEAAELLARWMALFRHSEPGDVDPTDELLKEHCLARLRANPEPARPAKAEKTTCHMCLAAAYDDRALVETYLAMDPKSVDLARSDGRDAVFFAAAAGSLQALDALLAAGARPDRPDDDGWQPIHVAATGGQAAAVARLLAAGVRADAPGPGGKTAVFLAAQNGHLESFRLLAGHETGGITDAFVDGWTVLQSACRNGHASIVAELLRAPGINPSLPTGAGHPLIHLAIYAGSPAIVEALLADARVDPTVRDPNGNHPLHVATELDELAIADLLLRDPRVDPNVLNSKGASTLLLAVSKRNRNIVERLLAHPATNPFLPHENGITPLGLARKMDETAKTGDGVKEILGLLLEDPRVVPQQAEKDGWTPLLIAAAVDRFDVVSKFLDRPEVSPAASTDSGTTLLHLALKAGDEDIASRLIADPRVDCWRAESNGETALHVAVRRDQTRTLDLLLGDRRVSDDVVRAHSSVLALAARWSSQLPLLDRLLSDGRFDVNGADSAGLTALHFAVMFAHEAGVRRLLAEPGLDVARRDTWGRLPLDFAPDGAVDVLRALLAGANAQDGGLRVRG